MVGVLEIQRCLDRWSWSTSQSVPLYLLNCGVADSQGHIDEDTCIDYKTVQRTTNEGATRQHEHTQSLEYGVCQSSDAIILH
jgi:hypothetical protein